MTAVKQILIIILFLAGCDLFAQVEDILNPVEIKKLPEKVISDEQLAAQFFQNREFEKALMLYEKLFEEKGNDSYYSYYYYCLLELGQFDKAEKVVRKQIKKYPARMQYRVDLGNVFIRSGHTDKGEKQFEDAIRDLETVRNQVSELANAFLIRNQSAFAIKTYQKGRQLIRDYNFGLEIGNLYAQLGDHSKMVNEFLDYIDYDLTSRQVIQARLQNLIAADEEGKIASTLRTNLLRRVQKMPDRMYYSELLIWLSIQERDFETALLQSRSLDKRLKENGFRVYEVAELSSSNGYYDLAVEAFDYIIKKGRDNEFYIRARIGLIQARYLKIVSGYTYEKSDLVSLRNNYMKILDEFGRNAGTIRVMQYLAHLQAYYLDETGPAISLLEEAISIGQAEASEKAECKLELADILLFTGNVWDATLLYSQVDKSFKNDPVGHLAKFKNAKLSFYIGEFDWAKAQLDILKAATSKLIANDALALSLLISDNRDSDSTATALSIYARADLLEYRNQFHEALVKLDSVFLTAVYHPIFDEVLFKKAEILTKLGKFLESAAVYQEIIDKYPGDITADDAVYKLAKLNEQQLNNPEQAMILYGKLLSDYSNSLYTAEARKRFRQLRGDQIN